MDLLKLLQEKAKTIPLGDHSTGLSAVLLHIEVAFAHLSRGQSLSESTAFTDAIYRTNLAFEGGVKEAYRVFTHQDPSKKRPYEIEKYLESNKLLRPRILSQFTTYRTDWRNPSSHDYTLDFDEGEALLAIVSVSAFVYVLLDEISEKLAADTSRRDAESRRIADPSEPKTEREDLVFVVGQALQFFAASIDTVNLDTEAKLLGALHGFLGVFVEHAEILAEHKVLGLAGQVDLLVKRADSKVFVEIKRSSSSTTIRSGVNQLYAFSEALDADGILFIPVGGHDVSFHFIAHPTHRLAVVSRIDMGAFEASLSRND